jgi:hypothetical protein
LLQRSYECSAAYSTFLQPCLAGTTTALRVVFVWAHTVGCCLAGLGEVFERTTTRLELAWFCGTLVANDALRPSEALLPLWASFGAILEAASGRLILPVLRWKLSGGA